LEIAEMRSKEEHLDKSTTLRQWLYRGAEDYILYLLQDGRISISKAAELLEVTIYDIYRLASERGIELGATLEQYQKSLQVAKGALSKGRK